MVLVVDCFKLVKGVGKSIGIYNLTLNLVHNLVKEHKRENNKKMKDYKIVILGTEHNRSDFEIIGTEFVAVKYNPFNKITCILWEMFLVPFVCKKLKADRALFPRGFSALTHPIKDSIIVHDLIPFYYDKNYPGYFNKLENAYIMWRLKSSIKNCDQIITISEASKKDIIDLMKVDENKITVIRNGCNMLAYSAEKQSAKQYIVAITSDLPHKNADGVIRSYVKYCEISEKALPLTVIGITDVQKYNISADVKDKITCHKFIKEDYDLHRIIANGSIFMFLSLIEGFGFPPIEAMQLGVPIICSNRSSLPEVVGDAAVLVDPTDYVAVGKAIDDLVNDKIKRTELVEKGYHNIRRFSWESRGKMYWDTLMKY
ncbi:MAG: glycosyltransferase family 4 protein [Clostridiaceae bacterium]|nr:glycosyltransferase family 4 protein [Clostridiaceae bacterium]